MRSEEKYLAAMNITTATVVILRYRLDYVTKDEIKGAAKAMLRTRKCSKEKSVWKRRTKLALVVMGEEETARHWDILRDSEGLGEALKDSEGFYVSRNILRRLGSFSRRAGGGG